MIDAIKNRYKLWLILLISIVALGLISNWGYRQLEVYNIMRNLGVSDFSQAKNAGYGTCNTNPNAVLPSLGASGEICGNNNDVILLAKSSKYFGYRIGDKVTINVYMMASKNYTFNFSNLKQGTINLYGSEFKLLTKPAIIEIAQGKHVFYQITLKVQSFLANTAAPLAFTATLPYAIADKTANTGYTYGVMLTTPVMISASNTFGYGTTTIPGSLKALPNPASLASILLIILGLIFILLTLIQTSLNYINAYVRKPKISSKETLAWQTFNHYFKPQSGFDIETARSISYTLRNYFNVLGMTGSEIAVSKLLASPDREFLVEALSILDGAIFGSFALPYDITQKVMHIAKIIIPNPDDFHAMVKPRPWSIWTPFADFNKSVTDTWCKIQTKILRKSKS